MAEAKPALELNRRLAGLAVPSAVFMRILAAIWVRRFKNEPRMPKNHGGLAQSGHGSNDLAEARGFINKIERGGQGFFYI